MKKRNFDSIVSDIRAYVKKNPERKVPDIYAESSIPSTKINAEEEYCPPDINLDYLSSSEELKLRERGVIRKIVKKSEKPAKEYFYHDRSERKWYHTRYNELLKRHERHDRHSRPERHERQRPHHYYRHEEHQQPQSAEDTYKLAFQSKNQIDQSGVWKLFNKDRVFIREIRIDGNQVVVKFANQESGSRSAKTLTSSEPGISIKFEGPDGQTIKTDQ